MFINVYFLMFIMFKPNYNYKIIPGTPPENSPKYAIDNTIINKIKDKILETIAFCRIVIVKKVKFILIRCENACFCMHIRVAIL